MKNLFLKERKQENPYEIWVNNEDWEWRVLKKWQADDNKPYARWMCAVKSPFTHGGYDYGDVYVSEIKDHARPILHTDIWCSLHNDQALPDESGGCSLCGARMEELI